jgi:uncharacterized protein (TIGR04255 family)
MGTKLKNAPVYFTVAQVQFNPVLNLEGYLPAIQAKMRGAHLPDYRSEVVQRLVLPFGVAEGAQVHTPTLSSQLRYIFGDISGRASIVLESNTLAFQTTQYETFETFSATFLDGLGIVHDALRLAFVERIGLRYLDAILPLQANESLRDYLVPEVLGLSAHAKGKLQHSISETVSIVGLSQLVTRVLIQEGRVGLPLEIAQLAPAIDPRFTQQEAGVHAIVDNDASIAHREVFDLAKISEHLDFLHDEIKALFESTVTKQALSAWA